jgi:hypothetical protein
MTTTGDSTTSTLQWLYQRLQEVYQETLQEQEQYAHGIDPLRLYGQGRYADGLNTALGYVEAAINRERGDV